MAKHTNFSRLRLKGKLLASTSFTHVIQRMTQNLSIKPCVLVYNANHTVNKDHNTNLQTNLKTIMQKPSETSLISRIFTYHFGKSRWTRVTTS